MVHSLPRCPDRPPRLTQRDQPARPEPAVADDLRHCAEQGFVILERAADGAAIERIEHAISSAFRYGNPDIFCQRLGDDTNIRLSQPLDRLGTQIVDAYVPLPRALDLFATPHLVPFLETFLRKQAFLFQRLSFDQGAQQGLHRDTAYVVVDRPLELAACWIALEDAVEGTGELAYVPGSHRDDAFVFGDERSYWVTGIDGHRAREYSARSVRESAAIRGFQTFATRRGEILV